MFESILSVANAFNVAHTTYEKLSGIIAGKPSVNQYLDQINGNIEKLSDHILYDPNWQNLKDISSNSQRIISDMRDIREILTPIQKAFNSNILSSSVLQIPDKMASAMSKNPFDVLDNVSPISTSDFSNHFNKQPISFFFEGTWYIGWIKRGLLPVVFDCEVNNNLPLEPANYAFVPQTTKIIQSPLVPQSTKIEEPRAKKKNDNKGIGNFLLSGVISPTGLFGRKRNKE